MGACMYRTRYQVCFSLFSFFILRRMGHFHVCMYQIHVFRFNPRSRCNSSSRCWYRSMLHLEREARDCSTSNEYSCIVKYCCCFTYIVVAPIPISLLNFGGVACRIFFTSSANSPNSWWEGNLMFYPEGKYISKNVLSQTL